MTLRCEIVVEGSLESRLEGLIDGFEVSSVDAGRTLLVGLVPDRAALRGVMARLDDVGIGLVALDTRAVDDPE